MSNNPTSKQFTFLQLLSNNPNICNHCGNLEWQEIKKIEIPIIQRDYAQGRKGKEELRKNFLSTLYQALDKNKNLELDFVYGSVKDSVLQPLDGQQRLTTLFLLHWFIAVKENKLDEDLKKLLTKFTYETRTSSREFCFELINKGINYNRKENISDIIIDSSWFFLSWKKDPTIKSMLTMLDAIQETFKDTTDFWDKLDNISFHFIELQNFGLSDDLYIKMNARGKALTDFENFKAKFEQHIEKKNWEDNKDQKNKFVHKLDTSWTNLFWKFKNDKNVFDDYYLNFFRTMALINYALNKNKDENFEGNVRKLRGLDQNGRSIHIPLSFDQYLEFGCIDIDYFNRIREVLDKISSEESSDLKIYLPDSPYIDENKIFKGAIKFIETNDNKSDLSYPDLVIAYAYYQYLASNENIEVDKLKNWMRIVRNLVEGSKPYLFNNANDFANAIHSIKDLLCKNEIINYFVVTENISLTGFTNEQINEEKIKAKLINKNDDWKNTIIEIENHKYFNGQIGFILDWCKEENGNHNISKFNEYTEKSKAIFGEDGLNKFDHFLFERALLVKGDYLLRKGLNLSFLIDKERDISWKRLLRDDNDKRNYLKELLDSISIDNLKEDLEKVISEFSEKDWRYFFIKYHEIINECNKKFIRKYKDNNILLLNSTSTSGYHSEYYSYSLFIELKKELPKTEISYEKQKSINYIKQINIGEIKIAFDNTENKFVISENNTKVYKDVLDVIKYIKEKFPQN